MKNSTLRWMLAPLFLIACSEARPVEKSTTATAPVAQDEEPSQVNENVQPSTPAPRKPNVVIAESQPAEVGGIRFEVKRFMTAEHQEWGGIAEILVAVDGQEHSFTDGPKEAAPKTIVWTEKLRIELVASNTGSRGGSFYVDEITDGELPASKREFKIARRQKVELDGGWQLEFRGHGHKTVQPGQQSPLIVEVRYYLGQNWDHASYSLSPPEQATWRWRDYELRVLKHDYDKSMQLRVHRLKLAPLGSGSTKP